MSERRVRLQVKEEVLVASRDALNRGCSLVGVEDVAVAQGYTRQASWWSRAVGKTNVLDVMITVGGEDSEVTWVTEHLLSPLSGDYTFQTARDKRAEFEHNTLVRRRIAEGVYPYPLGSRVVLSGKQDKYVT